jgi:hypothetical protein
MNRILALQGLVTDVSRLPKATSTESHACSSETTQCSTQSSGCGGLSDLVAW